MTKKTKAPSDRTRLRRAHARGAYDFETVGRILDAQPLCTVAYCVEGKPFIVPTFQWRHEDRVYWHGSSASRALRASHQQEVCLNVCILDGLVLARSAFHHSANYRSVTVYGVAEKVEGKQAKNEALKGFVDALIPERWSHLRPMTDQEVKATTILSMSLEEASAKIRTGGPIDDEEDYELPIWAGVLPVTTVSGDLVPDNKNQPDARVPEHLKTYQYPQTF